MECYGSVSATSTQACPVPPPHPQSLFLVVPFLIPTPKASPFLLTIPPVCYILVPGGCFHIRSASA